MPELRRVLAYLTAVLLACGVRGAFGNPGLAAEPQPWGHRRILGSVVEVPPAYLLHTTPLAIEPSGDDSPRLSDIAERFSADEKVVVVLQATRDRPESPFNSYEVFLSPRKLPGTCAGEDPEQFRNRTYTFLGSVYPAAPAVTLHNGKAVERSDLGTVEWETSLIAAEPMKVATRRGTLLTIGANHVHGSGGATHVLVVECRNHGLTVWFEAAGEGIRTASFDPAAQELSVSRWIWSSTDAHCCPGKEGQERYRWRPQAGRFVRIGKTERPAPK